MIVTAAVLMLLTQLAGAQHPACGCSRRPARSRRRRSADSDSTRAGRPLAIESARPRACGRGSSPANIRRHGARCRKQWRRSRRRQDRRRFVRPLGRAGVGVGVRAGTTSPRSARRTRSRKRCSPRSPDVVRVGATARPRAHARDVGDHEPVRPKLKLAPGSEAATEEVAAGHEEIVLTLASEILPAPGLDYSASAGAATGLCLVRGRSRRQLLRGGRRSPLHLQLARAGRRENLRSQWHGTPIR